MQGSTLECPADHLAGIDRISLQVHTLGFQANDAAATTDWAQRLAATPITPIVTLDDEFDVPVVKLLAAASETPHGERHIWVEADVWESVEIVRTGRAALCSVWRESCFEPVETIDRDLLFTSLNRAWQLFLDAWQRAPAELAAFEAEVRDEPTDLYPPSEN